MERNESIILSIGEIILKKKSVLLFSLILIFGLLISLQNIHSSINEQIILKINHNISIQLFTKAWEKNGNPVCIDPFKQSSVHMITIENGSAFLIWKDMRNDEGDIYGQIIDSNGSAQWQTNGRILVNETGVQNSQGLIYSGLNCAIFVWEDNRSSNRDIYAQKINLTTGNPIWNTNGTIICNEINDQIEPDLVSDGNGGAIITWIDNRDNSSTLFVQRINSTGSIKWTPNGTLICNKTNTNINSPQISIDGLNGSIIAWYDNRTGNSSIYCQKINSSGSTEWTDNGTIILNLNNLTIFNLQICTDGLNGSIVAWCDNRTGLDRIYAQRINGSGISRWIVNGTPVCNLTNGEQRELEIHEDGQEGVILVWKDFRAGAGNSDLYSQKLNSTGGKEWDTNGTAICKAPNHQYSAQLISDNEGGAVITWLDNRKANYRRIYVQRVYQNKDINWTENGVLICEQPKTSLAFPIITLEENVGAYISWLDDRIDVNFDIYIQKIFLNGSLLYSEKDQTQTLPIIPKLIEPFYQQTWFYVLLIILLIDILLIYYYFRRQEEEEKVFERKV